MNWENVVCANFKSNIMGLVVMYFIIAIIIVVIEAYNIVRVIFMVVFVFDK